MVSLETMSLEERQARSGLVVVVPEVAGLIDRYRRRYTAAGAGVPPHVTLMSPFFAPAETTPTMRRRIRRIVAAVPRFDFALTRAAWFPGGVLYLTPEPAAPFLDLIARLRRAFPEVSPYWDRFAEVVPHLAIADAALADPPGVLDEVEAAASARLPVRCAAREAVLLQRVRPSPAPWDVQGRFPLADPADLG